MVTDLFDRVAYNDAAKRWYYLSGSGRTGFVSETVVREEMQRHGQAMMAEIENLTRSLYAGEMTTAEWEVAVSVELKNAHLAQATFARGGASKMGPEQFGRIGGNLRDEYGYLREFAQQIEAETVSEANALRRVRQYGLACEQSYWKEWGRQQEGEGWENLPYLNQTPRDGRTQCHGNCACYLETDESGIHWRRSPVESCPDCKDLEAGGPYQPGKM